MYGLLFNLGVGEKVRFTKSPVKMYLYISQTGWTQTGFIYFTECVYWTQTGWKINFLADDFSNYGSQLLSSFLNVKLFASIWHIMWRRWTLAWHNRQKAILHIWMHCCLSPISGSDLHLNLYKELQIEFY